MKGDLLSCELMTPGAWEKSGVSYKLWPVSDASVVEAQIGRAHV